MPQAMTWCLAATRTGHTISQCGDESQQAELDSNQELQALLLKPLNVDARSCDLKTSSLLLHFWVWSQYLKRILMHPNNQHTREGFVAKV